MSITDKIFFPCVIIWKKLGQRPFDSFLQKVCPWLISLLKKMTFPMETGVRRLKDTQQILVPFKPSREDQKADSTDWLQFLGNKSGDSLLHRLLLGNWVPRPLKLIYFSQENLVKISLSCKSVPPWNNHHQPVILSSIGMPMNNQWMVCTNVYLTLVEVVHSDIF